jgi:MarR family transcriptional regulator, organic hydroperoxide resistance regulator
MPDLTKLFNELVRVEGETWGAVDSRLRNEHGLQLARYEALRVIGSHKSSRVYDIVAELGLTTGGASKIVDTLEASGYCERQPNPGDRRSSIIKLTPDGRRLLTKATKTVEAELENRIGSVLPDRSLQQLTEALVKLREGERAKRGTLAA